MKRLASGALLFFGLTVVLCLAVFAEEPQTRQHWAFQPITRTAIPSLPSLAAIRNPIDAFVLTRLEKEGIASSPEAPREMLLRRLSLDLIGLPPTIEELDAFLADAAPDAYDRQVTRLLASPHFGEKWARGWLDLAAYADSDGYLSDFVRPQAWRYRQWLVDALNANKPYDQFTMEQIAGDLLPEATVDQRMGTGFFRNTLNNREGGADLEEFRVKQIVARTSMLGTAWLGLTVGCAECHDHKFDPIAQSDFYGLYAFFNNADELNIDAPLEGEAGAYASAKNTYDEKRKALLAPVAEELNGLQVEWEARLLDAGAHPEKAEYVWARAWEVLGLVWGQNYGEGQLEGTLILKTPWPGRTPAQRDRLQDYFLQNGAPVNEAKWAELKLNEITKQLDELAKALPPLSRAPTLQESWEQRKTHLHHRGDFRAPKEEITPHTPAVLPALNVAEPTRLDLAQWLMRRDNPLTARVAVNRIWQELFGRGLVFTSEDFGTRGSPPSHPELLDWLAAEFMESGWDVKGMIRLIVSSATYRQSSDRRPELNERDPANVLLARQSRVRLTGELVRDAALFAGGILNTKVGGPSVRPPQPDSVSMEGFLNAWVPSEGADRYRRGLYTFLQRTSPYGQSVTFDLPDPGRPCTRRDRSNTPLQALNLLNDPVFVEAAQGLARRVQAHALEAMRKTGSVDTDACIDHACRLSLGRIPSEDERSRLKQHLAQQVALFESSPEDASLLLVENKGETPGIDPAAWTALASVLLNLDEFITRE